MADLSRAKARRKYEWTESGSSSGPAVMILGLKALLEIQSTVGHIKLPVEKFLEIKRPNTPDTQVFQEETLQIT